jgi:integrase
MARKVEMLTAARVKNAKPHVSKDDPREKVSSTLIADGGGLYLRITASGTKSWLFRYRRNGRLRDMGLGAVDEVTLAQARRLAGDARQQLAEGKDPLEAKAASKPAPAAHANDDAPREPDRTFEACAKAMLKDVQSQWRNEKHRAQWATTLAMYAYPIIGSMHVADITVEDVMRVLQQPVKGTRKRHAEKGPFWNVKTETASRVRGRIEAVLGWAKVTYRIGGDNPARWDDNLERKLPAQGKIKKVRHHPALPYTELPEFMKTLRTKFTSISARALELVVLTACRTGEVRGAKFDEFDLEKGVWIIPEGRMKASKEHKVPLMPRAVEIVKELAEVRISDYVFPSTKPDSPISDMGILQCLRGIAPGVTSHGMRSALKDWALDCTEFEDYLTEAALAHASADKVRNAYARSNLFARRRRVMQTWSDYLDGLLVIEEDEDGVRHLVPAKQLPKAA